MTTPTVTSSTDSQMHNNIMAAGSRDRPPMLATGRYPQWRARFLRYIDTRTNDDALRKCILSGPCKPTTVLVQAVAATDDPLTIPEHTTFETPMNMSPENKAHFQAEKEAIHLILTGIGDEIYSTIDACQTAQEMWEAIERFYKLMNEMIRNNLAVATMQVNVQFLQQLQPEWSRFVTIVKQQHKLDEVSYHKLFDILKQYQKEVNELRAERLAKNANPLALITTAQANQDPYYQTSKSYKSHAPSSKPSIPTRSHTTTRYKGKEIAKPITPPSETAFEEESDPEQAQRDKDMQKNLALIEKYFKKIYKPTNNLRTSSNSRNKNVDMTLRYKNDNQSGQFRNQRMVNVVGARENECRKPKRVKDFAYHKEKMLMCKQAEQGVSLQAEQYDWLADTDEEIDEQELEAHYSNTCLVEIDDINVIPDSPDMCEDDIQNDQNDIESDDEHVALANLKLDVDENKKIQKQLKKANTTLAQELKECKTILVETSNALEESISVRDSCLVALQTKQTELRSIRPLMTEPLTMANLNIKHSKDQFCARTAQDMEILIQTCLMPLAIKTQNDSFIFVHELKQEMHADLKYVESFEKEIDELESDKAEFSNIYDMILQECVSKDVMCSYLLSLFDLDALDELQCLYLHKVKECDCLAQKLSKQTESVSKKTKSVPKTNVSEGLSKPVTAQTLPQTARQAVSNTNVLKPGMYRIDNRSTQTRAPQLPQTVRNTNPRMSTSTGVNHKTNVNRPQHKSSQLKDKVVLNNSQVKLKKNQEDVHPRIPSVSNKMKSVTACKDSLNSRTLNANAVCATCNKCLVDSNHFACVSKLLNDVNARTKKPNPAGDAPPQPPPNTDKIIPFRIPNKTTPRLLTLIGAKMWILSSLCDSLQEQVVTTPGNAKALWDHLKDLFHDNKDNRAINLDNELRSIKIGTMTVNEYCTKIRSMADRLKNLGCVVSDKNLVMYTVNGLDSRFATLVDIILHRETLPSFETIRTMLLLKESSFKDDTRTSSTFDGSSSSPTALVTSTSSTPKGSSSKSPTLPQLCNHFNKGTCRFGDRCKYVHDHRNRVGLSTTCNQSHSTASSHVGVWNTARIQHRASAPHVSSYRPSYN
nr:hybrid signal transduction histidine kinase M [Tanacetum cinerariifolium]